MAAYTVILSEAKNPCISPVSASRPAIPVKASIHRRDPRCSRNFNKQRMLQASLNYRENADYPIRFR
jgi:hypothetical protein